MGVESTEIDWRGTIPNEGGVSLSSGVTSRGSCAAGFIGDGLGRAAEGLVGWHILAGLCGLAGQRHTSSARAGASE